MTFKFATRRCAAGNGWRDLCLFYSIDASEEGLARWQYASISAWPVMSMMRPTAGMGGGTFVCFTVDRGPLKPLPIHQTSAPSSAEILSPYSTTDGKTTQANSRTLAETMSLLDDARLCDVSFYSFMYKVFRKYQVHLPQIPHSGR